MSRVYAIDGVEYPSVTTVLGLLSKGDALLGWAVKCAIEYIKTNMSDEKPIEEVLELARTEWKNARETAADIGTEIHDKIHKYITYGRDACGEMRPEVENGFLAFLDWEQAHKVKWVQTELQVVSRVHGFAGRLDAICDFDGKRYLIDFKSSKAFYDEMPMQLAAYRIAAAEGGSHTEGIGILRLDKETGLPEWKDYSEVQDNQEKAFLNLIKFYYSQKNRRLKNNPFVLKPSKNKPKEIEVYV